MILADSSVWIDYFNGRVSPETDTLDALLGQQLILTGDLILAEVLQGFRREKDYRIAPELFEAFEIRNLGGRAIGGMACCIRPLSIESRERFPSRSLPK